MAIILGVVSARLLAVPLYADQIGASKAEVGLLFSVGTLAGALLALPAGVITDRIGRRQVIVAAIAVAFLTQVGSALTSSIPLLFVLQFLGGLTGGAGQTALMAALADVVPANRLGRSMGWLTLSMQTGFLAGPAVAGLLLHWLTLPQDLGLTALPLAVAFVLALGLSGRPAGAPQKLEFARPLRDLAGRQGFWAVSLALLAGALLWGTFQAYMPIFGKHSLKLNGTEIGYLLALVAVVNGLARIPGGRLLDRLPRKGAITAVGIVVFALAIAVLPHLQGFWVPALLLVLAVPFMAVSFVAVAMVFGQLADAKSRGIAMGMYSFLLFMGLGLGPAIFAPVVQSGGYTAGFTAAAAAAAVLAGLSLVARHEAVRRRLRERAVVLPPV
jgi:MFS family permease